MESVKFRNPEEIKHLKIPFELTEESLSDWLYSLLAFENIEAIRKLFYLLEALSKTDIPVQRQIVFLNKINDYIKLIVERARNISQDMGFPLEPDEQSLIEMIVWCNLCMAKSQYEVANKISSKTSKVFAWYQALYSLSQAYLYMSSTYTAPCKGFWRLCFSIYSSAEQAKLLKVSLSNPELKDESIDKVFKQIVVFSLSDPNQFRATEMRLIFEFLGKFHNDIKIESKTKEARKKGVFVFDSLQDSEPLELATLSYFKEIASTRYLESISLAKQIYEFLQNDKTNNKGLNKINKALYMRLIKTLGLMQSRKYTRVEDNRTNKGVTGYVYISSYLRSKNKAVELEVELMETEIEKETKNKKPADFNLVPIGDEHAHQMRNIFDQGNEESDLIKNIYKLSSESTDTDVWNSSSTDSNALIQDIEGSDFSLINSSAKGYGLNWNSKNNKAKLGEVLGIISSDSERMEISIVRRILQLEDNNVFLGVEVIGFESIPVYVTKKDDSKTGYWAIYLPGVKALKQPDSILFKSGDFEVGETIIMQENIEKHECRLAKLSNTTNSISQVELSYEQLDDDI